MSEAAQRPSFDPVGAPISLLVDFDGTISQADVPDMLLARFVADQDLVRRMDQLYLEGRKGSRDLPAGDREVLPRDPELLLREVDALPLDETFEDLLRAVEEVGAAIEIVSDGTGFHVERMLARLDLTDVPIATNADVLGEVGSRNAEVADAFNRVSSIRRRRIERMTPRRVVTDQEPEGPTS